MAVMAIMMITATAMPPMPMASQLLPMWVKVAPTRLAAMMTTMAIMRGMARMKARW